MNYVIKIIIINTVLLVLLAFGIIVNFAISNHLSNSEARNDYPAAIEKIKSSNDIEWLRESFASTVKLRHSTNYGLIKWHNKTHYFLIILTGLCLVNFFLVSRLKKSLLTKQT